LESFARERVQVVDLAPLAVVEDDEEADDAEA
jgi:hypothetical protein